jgi:predicted dehydrogenase
MPNAGRYSDDNLAATLRFAGGSVGTITYTANGDRSFSKERVEVFVQGRVAILDDFRELQTIRDGKHRVTKTRQRVDKGHRGEWEAFADVIRRGGQSPISLNELLNSTLATLALVRASSAGSMIEVSTEHFLSQVLSGRVPTPSLRED